MRTVPQIRNHQELVRRLGGLLTEVAVDEASVRKLVAENLRFANGHLGNFSHLANEDEQLHAGNLGSSRREA